MPLTHLQYCWPTAIQSMGAVTTCFFLTWCIWKSVFASKSSLRSRLATVLWSVAMCVWGGSEECMDSLCMELEIFIHCTRFYCLLDLGHHSCPHLLCVGCVFFRLLSFFLLVSGGGFAWQSRLFNLLLHCAESFQPQNCIDHRTVVQSIVVIICGRQRWRRRDFPAQITIEPLQFHDSVNDWSSCGWIVQSVVVFWHLKKRNDEREKKNVENSKIEKEFCVCYTSRHSFHRASTFFLEKRMFFSKERKKKKKKKKSRQKTKKKQNKNQKTKVLKTWFATLFLSPQSKRKRRKRKKNRSPAPPLTFKKKILNSSSCNWKSQHCCELWIHLRDLVYVSATQNKQLAVFGSGNCGWSLQIRLRQTSSVERNTATPISLMNSTSRLFKHPLTQKEKCCARRLSFNNNCNTLWKRLELKKK